jgi:hypothetical protein
MARLLVAISVPALFFGQTQIVSQQSRYVAPGTGAVARSGQSKLAELVSVKDYGAVGDGATDDLPAINRAFAAVSGLGRRLLFPAGTYMVSGPVVIPDRTQVIGVGRGDPNWVSLNTTIKALPTFPAGGTLVQLGPGPGPDFSVQIQNLTIDGSAVAGTCLSNSYAEEMSYGRDLELTNCSGVGLYIATTGSQNSGPFENLEIYPGATGNANSLCLQVTGTISFRGVSGVTCNGAGYTVEPNLAVSLEGNGQYSDFHIESFTTGVSLGTAVNSADGMTLNNVEFGPNVVTGVLIPNSGKNNQNLVITGLNCVGCTKILEDDEVGVVNNDNSVGWYMIGNGTGGARPMMTGQNGIGNTFIGPFNNYGNAAIAGQFFVNEGLSLTPTVPQPSCTSNYRGTFWFIPSPSGTADHLQVCSKSASDTFSWVTVF